jgi:hypothetical protein
MKKLCLVLLLMISAGSPIYSLTVEFSAYPHLYTTNGADSFEEFLHLQYGMSLRTGISQPITDRLSWSTSLGIDYTGPSMPYGNLIERGFTSVSLSGGIDYSIAPYVGIKALLAAHSSSYLYTAIFFSHLQGVLVPHFHIYESDTLDLMVDLPLIYDMRRDTPVNLAVGVGLRVLLCEGADR